MRRLIAAILVVLFGFAVGPFAYRTYAPLQSSEYSVGGTRSPFILPADLTGGRKSIYMRREVHLTRTPRHAWLEVLANDVALIQINGLTIEESRHPHPYNPAASILDITQYLSGGKNVIAIAAIQKTLEEPAMFIDGQVVINDGASVSLAEGWKCSDHFEHGAAYWYERRFDDSHWVEPDRGELQSFKSQVMIPPGSIRREPTAQWISPSGVEKGQGAVRRDFNISGRPQSGWLRVQTTAPFRLSINGEIIFDDHDNLAAPMPYSPRFYIFDISPRLHSGHNHVALMLTSPSETPHVAADFEVTMKGGRKLYWDSDALWVGRKGAPTDWALQREPGEGWDPCRAEVGQVDGLALRVEKYFASARYRVGWWSELTLHTMLCSLAAMICGWLGSSIVGTFVRSFAPHFSPMAPYAALGPAATAAFGGMLLTYDTTITQSDVYRIPWLIGIVGLTTTQWAGMLLFAMFLGDGRQQTALPGERKASRLLGFALLSFLVCSGLYLRTKDILLEPMHHDEVGAYFFTQSVFELGFPGGRVHPDMPAGYCATSELVYFFNAPFTLLFEEPRLVIRVPAVIWSMYTLILLFFVSRRLFGLPTAVVASALFCYSPYLINMANFGRYFCQLQFFALLTCYGFYRTIDGRGPINRKWLWVTAISFLAMYFSWEGSGFTAIGMIVAALIHRRGNLKSILLCPSIYASLIVVGSGILAQNSHRTIQQTQRLWYGTGISDVSVMPMWRYPRFDLLYYVREATWMADSALPLLCALGLVFLAVRHPRREPIRVFMVIFLITTIAMVMLLPLRATRYAFHMTPLFIMLSGVLITTLARQVALLARSRNAPEWSRTLCNMSAFLVLAMCTLYCSGYFGQLIELDGYRTAAYRPNQLKFPHWDEPLRYVRKHLGEDDAVIALHPHIVNMTMHLAEDNPVPKDWRTDYWMQSVMVMQASLSDSSNLPRDRRTGAVMIGDKASLERVLAKHKRVWYLTIRYSHSHINHDDVSELLRKNMDIVYEDHATVVMLYDQNQNRTAEAMEKGEQSSEVAQVWVLK